MIKLYDASVFFLNYNTPPKLCLFGILRNPFVLSVHLCIAVHLHALFLNVTKAFAVILVCIPIAIIIILQFITKICIITRHKIMWAYILHVYASITLINLATGPRYAVLSALRPSYCPQITHI